MEMNEAKKISKRKEQNEGGIVQRIYKSIIEYSKRTERVESCK